MAIETVSYSEAGQGWNTFHSFIPDWMIGLNSSLYTWKNGNLYKHHDNATRNNYYGTQYDSTITPIFNDSPTEVKMLKTIELEGNDTWQADCTSDLDNGIVETDYYKEKEGTYYGYIRRDAGTIDLKATSTKGIGSMASFASPTLTFSFSIPGSIAIGDKLHVLNTATSVLTEIGDITAFTSTTITVGTPLITPNPGDFIVATKDSTAESRGVRGYYMEVKLKNTSTSSVELFSVSSEIFKSSP